MSSKSVAQECQVGSVKQECLTRVSNKSVGEEVSSKKCQVRMCYKSVNQERVSEKKCQVRVSEKSISQARMSHKSVN